MLIVAYYWSAGVGYDLMMNISGNVLILFWSRIIRRRIWKCCLWMG